jgi:5-methylcytosine-specific restriction endonuclease McrA
MTGDPEGQVQFLLKIQNLLTEGRFTASYKFALLLALCDLSVELSDGPNGELHISLTRIAEKFVTYYWRHVLPYIAGHESSLVILRQNTSGQAEVIGLVQQAHRRFDGSLPAAQADVRAWRSLTSRVRRIVLEMPLWKLQRLSTSVDPFLYQQEVLVNDCIVLMPGVAQSLRAFHGLISELARTSWIRYIRQTNAAVLQGERDLSEFLFGVERGQLGALCPLLREIQSGCCFYCAAALRGPGEVDHFIPWSRYSLDYGHNFVLAHPTCNREKGAYLAAEDHLGDWVERNELRGEPLTRELRGLGFASDWNSSRQIARWAYEGAAILNALLWQAKQGPVPMTGVWTDLLRVGR